MLRPLAIAALALVVGVSVAHCQSAPKKPAHHAPAAVEPPPPQDPTLPDPVAWMTKAVGDILAGKVPDGGSQAPQSH